MANGRKWKYETNVLYLLIISHIVSVVRMCMHVYIYEC